MNTPGERHASDLRKGDVVFVYNPDNKARLATVYSSKTVANSNTTVIFTDGLEIRYWPDSLVFGYFSPGLAKK